MTRLLRKRIILITAVLLVVSAGLYWFGRRQQSSSLQYFTAIASEGPLRNVVSATGVVQTVVTVQVGSQVSGQVQELYADFNTVVRRGQLLARLDPRNFETQVQNSRANVAASQARVRSAEAELRTHAANVLSSKANLEAARVARENAVIQFRRAQDLQQRGLLPQSEFDNAKANADSAQAKYDQAEASLQQIEAQGAAAGAQVEQVRAQLQQAQADLDRALLNLEYCNIYSPVDGVVISRNVDVGQTIASSLQAPTLFTIANDLAQMQVNASVDEADIGNISASRQVEFTVDAYPNDVFPARISEIRLSPQTVQNVVTYSVILTIDNSERKLRPGMTANISMTVDERDKAVRVPNAALRYTPPGQVRPPLPRGGERAPSGEESNGSVQTANVQDTPSILAPGQKWDPAAKIQFAPPGKVVQRPAVVWILPAQGQPEMREILVGITDGSMTEVISGVKPGEAVVVEDSTQASTTTQQRGFAFGPPGGGRGPF